MAPVDIIEVIAEAIASIVKAFSSAPSDWLGKRTFLATLGFGFAALALIGLLAARVRLRQAQGA